MAMSHIYKIFVGHVCKSWLKSNFTGGMDFVLKEKFKSLKGDMKRRNKFVFNEIDAMIEILVREINLIDVRM